MRILIGLFLLSATAFAEQLPLLGLAHVAVRVSDLEKSRAGYRENEGKSLGAGRISTHLEHAGIVTTDLPAARRDISRSRCRKSSLRSRKRSSAGSRARKD